VGEDRETDRLFNEGTISFAFTGIPRFAFDIVTVEGEGCSSAGWEEISSGDTERRSQGISGDASR